MSDLRGCRFPALPEGVTGAGVPEEAFEQPCRTSQGAFVSIWSRAGVQDQARASFVSPVIPRFPTRPREERYYHLTEAAADAAARDIAQFLL
jgi:hypothetical protein